MKKTNKPIADRCPAIASSGALTCALDLGHAGAHSTAPAGRKVTQRGTWIVGEDGRIAVTTFSHGKKMAEWFEDLPTPKAKPMALEDEPEDPEADEVAIAVLEEQERKEIEVCGAPKTGIPGGCQLFEGHAGEHFACLHGHAHAWKSGSDPNAWEICGARWSMAPSEKKPVKLPADKQTICVRPGEHDGAHRGLDYIGNHMGEWDGDGARGGVHKPKTKIDFVAEVLGCSESNDDPETKEPSLADACAKCGREIGEHDGKKCPKPAKESTSSVGKDRLEHVYGLIVGAPGKDATALAGVHRRALKELEQAGRIEWRDDGWHPTSLVKSIPGGVASTMPAPKPGQATKVMTLSPQPAPTWQALTKIGDHEIHPAAALFPMLSDEERPPFVADIQANGQRKKIVRIKVGSSWLILDGRNRLQAVLELGFEPKFRVFGDEPGDGTDPIAFVISENIHRRHLNETQRAFVGAELVPMYQAQAKERMLAGKDPSPNAGEGTGKATEMAARAVNVGKTSVEAAIKVNRDATPEVIAASKDRGQMKVSTAAQLATLPKQKQREIVEKLGGGELRSGKVRSYVNQEKKRDVVRTINEQRVEPAPLGPFGTITIDPPWPYENSDQHEGSRGHLDYPSMSIQAICELGPEIDRRAKDDCILGMWVTNAFIHEVGRILYAWGFDHRSMITWDKEVAGVGMLPRGQTEHLVIATRGTPVHTLNEITTMLRVRKREHSRKPDEMYELLAKHCSGPRLDMFSREHREGWSTWGAEPQKFATEAA